MKPPKYLLRPNLHYTDLRNYLEFYFGRKLDKYKSVSPMLITSWVSEYVLVGFQLLWYQVLKLKVAKSLFGREKLNYQWLTAINGFDSQQP